VHGNFVQNVITAVLLGSKTGCSGAERSNYTSLRTPAKFPKSVVCPENNAFVGVRDGVAKCLQRPKQRNSIH